MTDALLVLVVITFLGWAAVAFVMLHRLRRRNAVGGRAGCGAPLRWLASPGLAAHLHRRLRRAVGALRVAVPPPRRRAARNPFHEVADDLEAQARAIDAELVAVRGLPLAHRRDAHRLATARVAEIERLAAQVVATTGGIAPSLSLDGLATRIEALQQAHDELARIERFAGLRAS
jgi:hypothetical protein